MEFNVLPLNKCVNEIIDYRGKTPKKLNSDWMKEGEFRAISAKNIKNMELVNESSIKRADKNLYEKWMKKEVEKNDILLTSEAPLGESLLWDSDEKIILSQRVFGLKPNLKIIDSKYLFAFMQTKFFKYELISRESGTTVTGIRRKELEKTKIKIFELKYQKYIGDFHYTINKKIKLNKKIIANLEELSQTLFKHWFVDFEFPDENGNSYKSSGGEMVESELGEIPKDWKLISLNEISSIISKGTTPKKEENSDLLNIPFLRVKDIEDDYKINKSNLQYISEKVHENQLKRSKLYPLDILVSIAGTIGRLAYVSNVFKNLNINQAICFIRLQNKRDFFYVYNYLKLPSFQFYLDKSVVQAVQANVSLKVIKNFKIIFPNAKVIDTWEKSYEYIYKYIELLEVENESLINLRDILLPKLMSGEIEIPDEVEVDEDEL